MTPGIYFLGRQSPGMRRRYGLALLCALKKGARVCIWPRYKMVRLATRAHLVADILPTNYPTRAATSVSDLSIAFRANWSGRIDPAGTPISLKFP